MAVKTPQISIDPYTSTVPLVQIPPEQFGGVSPAQPLQGRFGRRGTGALAIGDAIIKGVLQGHAIKEERKNAQAKATIEAADAATEAAYARYQDSLTQAGGKVDDPNAKAAYDAYLGVFNQSKQAKAAFVMPPEGGKKTSGGQQKKGVKGEAKAGFAGIKEFFAANPHIVPQIALMAMQPKAPGQSQEAKLQDLQMKEAAARTSAAEQETSNLKYERGQQEAADKRAEQQRQVESAGGIDAVLADKKADPTLQQTARQMKFEALDRQSPEGRLKFQFLSDIQSGQSKNWTPEQRVMAGALGVTPQPVVTTRTGKNGHQEQIVVDPLTNQPLPGSKPLDLGPPAWQSEYYAKRAADHSEIEKAVASDPTSYGVTITGNAAADKAAISARAQQLIVRADFGIQSLADQSGRTGFEVQRDNEILTGVTKTAGLNAKQSPLDTGQVTMSYKGGKGPTNSGDPDSFAVGRDYFNKILDKFTTPATENGGIRGFRDTPTNPDKNPPEVMEAERKFLYKWVKNEMMTQKGKQAYTSAQADAILSKTALGQPITSARPFQPVGKSEGVTPAGTRQGGMTAAPPGPMKLYFVPGYNDPVELSDEDVRKAKAANIPIEDASGLLSQFQQ